ncbi:MAG: peptidyl-prolyl cis-trans isomerase [Woeseiaceae bacterium]|nr:peptidyl-prolyl cis-trans isomerase [Woeseiaceae bacterium]
MKNIIREPLVHFLAIGMGLFILFGLVAPANDNLDSKTIVVNRNALLTFVQYRSKAFNPEVAAARLDALSAAELDLLIADFVREEALHRQALALGMDANDYVIKQRLIQSLQFITNGFVNAAIDVSDEDVAEYYEANKDDYFVDPYITFTHVYFSTDRHGAEQARALAETKLAQLNSESVHFSESTRHGERFLYNVNYVERTADFIASHFGTPMATAVFELEPDSETWRGPFESSYGYHVVMLTRRTDGNQPELSEIEATVRDDAERIAINELNELAVQAIVDTYDVRMDYELENGE